MGWGGGWISAWMQTFIIYMVAPTYTSYIWNALPLWHLDMDPVQEGGGLPVVPLKAEPAIQGYHASAPLRTP